jgi:repressor LexA
VSDRGIEVQDRILEYIKQEIQHRGYPPSVREICAAVNLKSTSTVHGHLQKLEERGLIRRDSTKPRALEVLDSPLSRGRSVPIVGKVTVGMPISSRKTSRDYMTLPLEIAGMTTSVHPARRGEKHSQRGHLDGDYIVVREEPDASTHDRASR